MRKKGRIALWSATLFMVVVAVSVPQYFYFKGLEGLPESRRPVLEPSISTSVSRTYWTYLGGEGEPRISNKNPYEIIFNFFVVSALTDSRPFAEADFMLLNQAARSLLFREELYTDWHLSIASASIWISRNWTADEAISTVLSDSYFGHGLHGIESAAQTYLGVQLTDLTSVQTMFLLVIIDGPTRFDPWCNPEFHRKRFELLSERVLDSEDYASVELRQQPTVKCD